MSATDTTDWVVTYRSEHPERRTHVDPLACPHGCGHRAGGIAERNEHALSTCGRRDAPVRVVRRKAGARKLATTTCTECGRTIAVARMRRHARTAHGGGAIVS